MAKVQESIEIEIDTDTLFTTGRYRTKGWESYRRSFYGLDPNPEPADIFSEENQHPKKDWKPWFPKLDIAQIDSRIVSAADIWSAKQRVAILNKQRRDKTQKIEFGRLAQKIDLHIRGLTDIADRYKVVTGRKLGLDIGTWSDQTKPTGREGLAALLNEHLIGARITQAELDRILKCS